MGKFVPKALELKVSLKVCFRHRSGVEQLVEVGQTQACCAALPALARRCGPAATLSGLLDALEADLDARGLDVLNGAKAGDLARPRRFEMAAALNRLRTAAFASEPDRGGDGSF